MRGIHILKPITMKSIIIEQICHLSFDKRQSIMVRRDMLNKINKLIGVAMYHNGTRVTKSDIIAHSVDYLYHETMKQISKLKK